MWFKKLVYNLTLQVTLVWWYTVNRLIMTTMHENFIEVCSKALMVAVHIAPGMIQMEVFHGLLY